MVGRSVSVVEYTRNRIHASTQDSVRASPSATFTGSSSIDEVVIPSNLFAVPFSTPYPTGAVQPESLVEEPAPSSFDVREIALEQKEETERFISRSVSVSLGGLGRSRNSGYDSRANEFRISGPRPLLRNTSASPRIESNRGGHRFGPTSPFRTLNARQGSGLANSPDQHVSPQLATLKEGLPLDAEKVDHYGDYFGDAATVARPQLARSTSSPPPACNDNVVANRTASWQPNDEKRLSRSSNPGRNGDSRARRSTTATRQGSVIQRSASIAQDAVQIVADAVQNVADAVRRSSLYGVYEQAKQRGAELQRRKWAMLLFEYTFYFFLIAFVYLVLIGLPMWKGAVYWLYWVFGHKFAVPGTWAVTVGIAFL